jgi:uncharacterized protein YebE (UPF0316 family)
MQFGFEFSSPLLGYLVFPTLIFLARVIDVSLETVRIIMINRGLKLLSSAIGFIEILIWLAALGHIIQHLADPLNYIAYALGFAVGNYIGIWIENRLAMGLSLIRIITQQQVMELVIAIQSMGYGVTYVQAHGESGPGAIILAVVKRKDLRQVTDVVKTIDRDSFYTIEDVRSANMARFPARRLKLKRGKHGSAFVNA